MKKSNYLFALALGASTLTFAQVGIGTSTPSSPLDIQADDAAIDINNTAADGDPKINFQLSGTTTFSIGVDDTDDKLKIGTTAPDASTAVTVQSTGEVGIGTTSPAEELHVEGRVEIESDGTNTPGVWFDSDGYNSDNGETFIGRGSGSFTGIGIYQGAWQHVFLDDGNVGIGTTSPAFLLTTDYNANATFTNAATDFAQMWQNSGTNALGIATSDDLKARLVANNGYSLSFNIAATEAMTITTAGNVGIGNTSPTATLDVDGSAIFNESGAAVDFRVEGDTETNLLFVDGSADRIGIGTSTPTEKLHIVGTTTGDTPLLKIQSTASGDGDAFIELESNDAGESGITFTNPDNANPNGWALSSGDSWNESLFVWDNDNSTIPFIILHSGNVGIANTSPSVELDVTGDIEYTGTITDVSDRRLKENFSSIDSVLTKIMKIKGLSYNMINDTLKTREYGVIAQDVQAVFPEMVTTVDPENGYLGVAYIQLIPVLLEGMKEQQAIIEAQKKENESQKAEIESLKAEASSTTSSSEENAAEIETLKAQVQQLLQLIQQ